MTDEPWDKPSEKLKKMAETPEPELHPMTQAEKERRYKGYDFDGRGFKEVPKND